MAGDQMQIGEVASRTGLSLRTIRYYEEVGLVVPSARSAGGFRLYAEVDVDRLQLIKRMKPLEFSLEDTRSLLGILDDLEAGARGEQRDELLERLAAFGEVADVRVDTIRTQLSHAEEFAEGLRRVQSGQRSPAARS